MDMIYSSIMMHLLDILIQKDASKRQQALDALFEDFTCWCNEKVWNYWPFLRKRSTIQCSHERQSYSCYYRFFIFSQHICMGQAQVENFAKDQSIQNKDTGVFNVLLQHVLKKNCLLTFDSLYMDETAPKAVEKSKIIKAGRNILQRLVIAYKA